MVVPSTPYRTPGSVFFHLSPTCILVVVPNSLFLNELPAAVVFQIQAWEDS